MQYRIQIYLSINKRVCIGIYLQIHCITELEVVVFLSANIFHKAIRCDADHGPLQVLDT